VFERRMRRVSTFHNTSPGLCVNAVCGNRDPPAETTAAPREMHEPDFLTMRRRLLAWHDAGRRELPWRQRRDVYRTWVSEVMLQQTRVDQATPYFNRFVERFPDLESLSRADLDSVLVAWEGLGYYARARNLHAAANIVAESGFPQDYAGWRSLPGVGDYTAASVSSIVHGEARAAVDGNVSRVVSRVFAIDLPKGTRPFERAVSGYAAALLAHDRPGDFNEAMMDLGATVCQPQRPRCQECPVFEHCLAAAAGQQTAYPRRSPRRATPHVVEAAAILADVEGRLFLRRRPSGGLLGGLWEFPTIRVPENADPEQTLRSYLPDLGVGPVAVGALLATIDHAYSHFRVTIRAYACQLRCGVAASPHTGDDIKWFDAEGLHRIAMPRAHRRLVATVGENRFGP
jgi:A/G-specific adenine glycosylase